MVADTFRCEADQQVLICEVEGGHTKVYWSVCIMIGSSAVVLSKGFGMSLPENKLLQKNAS